MDSNFPVKLEVPIFLLQCVSTASFSEIYDSESMSSSCFVFIMKVHRDSMWEGVECACVLSVCVVCVCGV